MQNFGGRKSCFMGDVQMVNGPFSNCSEPLYRSMDWGTTIHEIYL